MILAQAQAQALGQEQERKGQELQLKTQNDAQKNQIAATSSQEDNELKRIDQQIKLRELGMKEAEMVENGLLKKGELEANIRNTDADTQVKYATADKTMAEAAVTAIEGGETYQKAIDIVAKSGEQADQTGPTAEFETDEDDEDDDDGRSSESTETET